MSLLLYAKALAFFRGESIVSLEDVRQILPFVLHDRLSPDLDAPFFEQPGHGIYRSDRLGWLRKLFDLSCDEFNRLDLDHDDPVGQLAAEFQQGLDGLSVSDVKSRLHRIERLIGEWGGGRKLYGHLYDDLLTLKYLHQRYTNYLRWLSTR